MIDVFPLMMKLLNELYPFIEQIPGADIKVPPTIFNSSKQVTTLISIIKEIEEKRYMQVIPGITMFLNELDSSITYSTLVPVMRHAAVLAQFAQVNTAEEMKDLLQSVALPIGSASIKRKSNWNVALNGYVGVSVGRETLNGTNLSQTKVSLGLTAPIGIAISHRLAESPSSNNKGTFIPSGTLYFSLLDIGNIVNARLKSDTTSIGNVKFSHFISLGIGYFINFRNSPFSAGLSWSYVPAYRDFKEGEHWIYKADAYRLRFSLLVDIPIIHFYNKTDD